MRTYTQDGVCLTESGLSQLQSLANSASRRRRTKPKLTLKIINQNSVAVLQTPPDPRSELSREVDIDDTRGYNRALSILHEFNSLYYNMFILPPIYIRLFKRVCVPAEAELMDGEGKSDSSPEREAAGEDESKGGESCKKRKRKPYRPGEIF